MFTRAIRNKKVLIFLLILFILLIPVFRDLRAPVVRVNELKGKIINGESAYRGNCERTGFINLNPILSEPKLSWSFKLSHFLNEKALIPFYSHIAYKNYVFVIDPRGILHALNADSGEEIWKIEEKDYFTVGKPWLIADDVLFYTLGGFLSLHKIEGVDIRTGREVFRCNLPDDEVVDKSGFIIKDGRLYFAVMKLGRYRPPFGISLVWPYIPEERVYAIDLNTNKIRWRTKVKCDVENYSPHSSVFAFSWYSGHHTLIYYNRESKTLISIDPDTGKIKRRIWINLTDAVPIVDGKLFLKGSIYDVETGEAIWRTIWRMDLNYKYFTTPAIKGNAVYFAASSDTEGNVFAFDIDTHKEKWETKIGKIIRPKFFFIAKSVIYLYEYDKRKGAQFVCLDSNNGKILWKYDPLKAIPDFDKIPTLLPEHIKLIYPYWIQSFTDPVPEFDKVPLIGNGAIYISGVDGLYKIH